MGRLIDADKLILHLNDYALQEAPFGRNDSGNQKEIYETIQEFMKAVEEQPTAFDVEKVLEQLEEEREQSYEDFESYAEEHGVDNDYEDWFFLGLVRAIEIVKRGGRDED